MRNLLTSFLDQRETIGNLLAPFLTGQPQQFAQQPNPNMLLQGAEAAQQPAPALPAPTEVLQKQVAEVPRAVDPMPTAAIQQKAPQQPPQSKSGGFFDGLAKFGESDFGQRLGDMMLGWGMGGTMQDSLSKGSQMIAAGNQDRKAKKQVNQTVEWLKSKGMDETEAQAVASDRASLNAYLIAMRKGVDPMQGLQQRKMELEIKNLESGKPGAGSSFGNLDAQAQAAGLVPGTPEYQNFMLNGGGAPATFRALDMQAQAAGLSPNTPEYNEFMATRGAGLSAGAAQEAKNQADISSGGAAAGAKEGGKKTMETGFSAWQDYGKLQASVGNIDDAIAAIDRGASAGLVYNMLPNVTEASASLKNALDRMGLDVIGSVTFGALSEGEMHLAMDTAAPRGLQPAELRVWLERKRGAQVKAAEMLADAAQYLTKPGNTINGWIERNRKAKNGNSGNSGETVDFSDYFKQ